MIESNVLDHHDIRSLDELLDVIDPLISPRFRGLTMSIYIEAGRTHEEARAARIRFKSAVLERKAELGDDEDGKLILEPALELIDDREFWEHQRGGLAFFSGKDGARSVGCSCRFPTMSRFGGDYYLLPLLQAAATAKRFCLLGVSEGTVFLARVSDLGEEPIPGVPESFAAALSHAGFPEFRIDQKEFSNQNRRATEHSLQALRVIEEAARRTIPDHQSPLVVTAVDFMADDFRSVCEYPNLVDVRLPGDPGRAPLEDLADEARQQMLPYFRDLDRGRGRAAMGALQRVPGLTLTRLPAIVRAASNGNVSKLTVAAGADCAAGFSGNFPVAAEQPLPPHLRCDLVDFAARQTLATGGELVVVGENDLSGDAPLIAQTRWTPVNRSQ